MGQSGHAAPEDRLRRAKTYARRGAAPASRGARGVLYRKFRQNGNRDCQPVLIHSTAMRNRVRFLPVLLLTFAAATAAPNLDRVANSITIYRDTYGVPHIFGPTDASCVFGYAYAQAEDNFWQIEDSYMRALGRASEVYGKKTLDDDLVIRTLEIPRLAQAEYEHAPAPVRALLDAFAEGLNYYLARHPQMHARLLTRFEPWYMLAFNRYALYYLFLYGETGIPKEDTGKMADQQGSNMWAIRPSKSATGHAMLFINPHQPFFGPGQWYEGHVHCESG